MGIAQKPAVAAAKPGVKPGAPIAKSPVPAPKTAASAPAMIAGSAGKLAEQKLTVTTTVLANGTIQGEPVTEEQIEVRVFATTPAMAVAGIKVKKNLGNYEAVEIFVSQSVPAYVEDLDSVQSQVNESVIRVLDERFAAFDPAAYGLGGETAEGNGLDAAVGGEGEAEADTSGEGEAEAGEITPDWVASAERADLEALMEANPDAFTFTADQYEDDDDLRSMMAGELFPEGEGEEGEATGDEASEEAYTQENLAAGSMDDLKAIYEAWEMGEFPKFNSKNEAVVKKKVIKEILELQANPPA